MTSPGARRDRKLIYLATGARAFGNGLLGVLLGIYLAKLGLPMTQVGAILSAGLIGAFCGAWITTFRGDRIGRRRLLVFFATLLALATATIAIAGDPMLIGAAAALGAVTGAGKDRGAMLAIESAILPSTIDDRDRTRTYAIYSIVQDVAQAAGGLTAGLATLLRDWGGVAEVASMRWTIAIAALFFAVNVPIVLGLSRRTEVADPSRRALLAPHSKRVLTRLSALFALDSIGGGFLGAALLSYFFYAQFGASEATIALLFMGGKVISASSHLVAAWLARRIGLINTMVFTHIPSSLILIAIAFAHTFWLAALLYLLREGLAEMDVPTRQSYVMAIVKEEERTFASGITSLTRMAAGAVAPLVAGVVIDATSLSVPLFIGAALKILYDLLLWRAFNKVKPPEERVAGV